MPLTPGQRIEVRIESLSYGGRGLARFEGLAVFVTGGLPGSVVRARVTRAKPRFAEAAVEAVVTPSPDAVAPFCPHFGRCGGCLLQDLAYPRQVAEKARQVSDAMERIGRTAFAEVRPLLASPEERGWRNRMEFAFAGSGAGLLLGLREGGSHAVVDVTGCGLMAGQAMEILAAARAFCRAGGAPAWDPKTDRGFWRHLVLRRSRATGEFLANVITTPAGRWLDQGRALGEVLLDRFPKLAGFVHSVRRDRKALAFGERTVAQLGRDAIEERLEVDGRSVVYRVGPEGFFQPNSAAAERLYGLVRELAGLTGTETVADLYCGSGGVALALADRARAVVGADAVESAVAEARRAARDNGVLNCRFEVLDVERAPWPADLPAPDVVVADPPRGGLTEGALDLATGLGAKRLVLVSCDPPALARDVARLTAAGAWTPQVLAGVDLFPHTAHVEAVALLTRSEG
ncbi:MAG: 23S rRNA (uracil(1939)-C(5))-methyltransferase RlmD [Desulfovibrionaceae bacterium]